MHTDYSSFEDLTRLRLNILKTSDEAQTDGNNLINNNLNLYQDRQAKERSERRDKFTSSLQENAV
jgi:hypothetical protein